ncbi:P-loop containing nucleoside triphosphate hydrolase protein, partial [Chytridium lagenaria]
FPAFINRFIRLQRGWRHSIGPITRQVKWNSTAYGTGAVFAGFALAQIRVPARQVHCVKEEVPNAVRPIIICGPRDRGSRRYRVKKNAKDYHFVTPDTMVKEIDKGNFIEHAQFSGNYYGTSYQAVEDVLSQNRNVILDIDELRIRLTGRGTETPESLNKRLEAATRELQWGLTPGSVDYVITNDDVDVAYQKLKSALGLL